MRCQRPDGSFYGTSGQCRKGTEAAAEDWREKFKGRGGPALQSEIEKMSAALETLSEEEREEKWDQWISKSFLDQRTTHRDGSPYDQAELDDALLRQARAWNSMIKEGPPQQLQNRIGEKRPAPEGMTPDVSSSGQRKWVSPEDGYKYSGGTKGVWRQNRVTTSDTDRRLPDISEFRRQQLANGSEWPIQKLPPREGLETNPDKLLASLTKKEKNDIVFNGLDASGNEGKALIDYYNANPAEKEARLREIAERYIAQGGRSGVSGKPVALPGLEPKAGEERASVDHFQPISTNRGNKELTPADIRRLADNGRNFLIAEEGPNSQRQARSWDSWLERKEREAGKKPKAPKAQTPRSTAMRQPQTAEQKGVKAMLEKKIAKQAKEMGVSVATIKGDEDFLQMALGGSGMQQWKGLS